jgi:hypothetical protein
VNFWATRSHTLRAEAEDEFRQMCLEFPQFGYDVLSKFLPSVSPGMMLIAAARVLDEKLKREKNDKLHPSHTHTPSSGSRKRHRGI